jgi:hypothetical protein
VTFCRLFTSIGVLNIPFILFVDGIVGEVSVFGVFSCFWVVIWLTCESRKPLIIYVDAERLETCHQNIYSQVKLQTIKKHRVVNVARDYELFVDWNLRDIIYEIDSFALRRVLWFDDPHFFGLLIFILVKCLIELRKLLRQYVSLRDDIKGFFSISFLHLD